MTTTIPTAFKKTTAAMVVTVVLCGSLGTQRVDAQEGIRSDLGWLTNRPGSEMYGQSSAAVVNNKSLASILAAGGKASVGANIVGYVNMGSTVHVNNAGLEALSMRNSQVKVVQNQVTGFIHALGGAATANSAFISGGQSRKSLSDSNITVIDNKAKDISAFGNKASILLGAGSMQMPGRAVANGILVNESDASRSKLTSYKNEARQIISIGGAALANAFTAMRSDLQDIKFVQADNTAKNVQSGGAKGALGWGFVAAADLSGVSGANAVTTVNSNAKGVQLTQLKNEVAGVYSMGGSALANSFNLAEYRGSELASYQALQMGNKAENINAYGGSGSLLKGALASVELSSAALANSVSINGGDIQGTTRHTLINNKANDVQATGGAAAANSVWLQAATMVRSPATLVGNSARNVSTSGGSASVLSGAVGEFEMKGRALANSLAVDKQSTLQDAPVALITNQTKDVQGYGGLASAGSVLLGQGKLQNTRLMSVANKATGVRATGFSGSAGAGLLFQANQQSMALANSLGIFGSQVDSRSIGLYGNTAENLSAEGGKLVANSVSVESGDKGASQLSADVSMVGNKASNMSTGASSMSGPLNTVGSESKARAAANAVVLMDGVRVDSASPLALGANRADKISAIGGTSLVNALAAYRGSSVSGSPITLLGNRANDVSSGGSYGQVGGIGSSKNGILVANGIYLEGENAARIQGTPISLLGNTAKNIRADGGRINVNATAVNGKGDVRSGKVSIANNVAERVSSQGDEDTVFGYAINRGVGYASANALHVLGKLSASSMLLLGNVATGVAAEKGLAAANSQVIDESGSTENSSVQIVNNNAADITANDGKTALTNSVYNEGKISNSIVNIVGNRGSAKASGEDAAVNSLSNSNGAQISSSRINILGNRGRAQNGSVNSIQNQGVIANSSMYVIGNTGSAKGKGDVNSIVNKSSGQILNSTLMIAGNQGSAAGGGLVNSIENHGLLSGRVMIMGNQGSTAMGGVTNSLQNYGIMKGTVMIAGNTGQSAVGGVSNSVINRGLISGTVAIVGNTSAAAAGITTGSVRNLGGAITGAAGVTGNVPWAANPGYTWVLPATGVVNRSVTVLPGNNVVNL
jgi:hypothetical protein